MPSTPRPGPSKPVPFILKRPSQESSRRVHDCVIDAQLHMSRAAADRLLEATQSESDGYVLSSRDGRVSVRVSLSLAKVTTTAHHTAHGRLVVDWSRSLASKGGSRVLLSQTEMRLLAALLESEGQAVSRARLIKRVWPDDILGASDRQNALAVYICSLRKRLAAIGMRSVLQTVRTQGYRIVL